MKQMPPKAVLLFTDATLMRWFPPPRSTHQAAGSQRLAAELNVTLLGLPRQCPEDRAIQAKASCNRYMICQ